MNTQNPENSDDSDEARVLVKTVLADFPQTTDFVRQLSGVNDACSVTDIVPLEGGDTAFAFSYGFADYALRIGNDPDTGERVLHDIVAMPLYDKAGAGFYAQLVCWLGHDFDGGQQYCRRISDSVALVTLPVQTEYEYEEGDDGITNISSALAPGIGHYAACLKENSVTAVEAIPAGIAANAYVLPVAATIVAALYQGRNIRENLPHYGLEFLCPLTPTEAVFEKQRLHLAWQEDAWMITIADYRLLDICKI